MNLDPHQQNVIDQPFIKDTVTKIKACAGAGKTTTSVMKIKSIIDSGIAPEQIIFNTFSNKSAQDLTVKYNKLTGYSSKPQMSTIHSLSLHILKKYFNLKPNLLNEWSSILVMRDALEHLDIHTKYKLETKKELTLVASQILEITQWYKANLVKSKHILQTDFTIFNIKDYDAPETYLSNTDFIEAFKTYELFKQNNNQFDYSDLVYKLYIMLLEDKQTLQKLKQDYPVVFVDEAQDLDTLLFKLTYLISEHNNLYLIYDEVQTIYSFRWSSPQMLRDEFLQTHFKNIQNCSLEFNYRSTKNIVDICNQCRQIAKSDVMSKPNKDQVKGSVRFIKVKNNLLEGEKAASLIQELTQQGYQYQDIAIISRTNSYLKAVIEPSLSKLNIPYTLHTKNRRKLFDKPLVKAYFDFITLMLNPTNQFALLSLAQNIKGIGDKFIDKLRRVTYTNKSIFDYQYPPQDQQKIAKIQNLLNIIQPLQDITAPDQLHQIIDKFEQIISLYFNSDFTNRKDLDLTNKALTVIVFTYYDQMQIQDLQEIFDKVLLDFTEIDTTKVKDSVKLLTVHAAKGLEYPVTIVGGFGQGQIKDEDIQSESCILYVQLSRAIEKLIILDSPIFINRKFQEQEAKYSQVYRRLKINLGV